MGSGKYFTSIDLCSGYWQCRIANEDIAKTAFLMRYGLYKWVVMPMRLTKTPEIFIQTMNNLFSYMLDSHMVVFLDDIIVYLRMVKEHLTLLEQVLVLLYQYIFYCKFKNCSFLHNSIIFLSFDFIRECMCIFYSKVCSLNE